MFEALAGRLGAELVAATELTGGSSADVWRLDLRYHDGAVGSVVSRRHDSGELAEAKGKDTTTAAREFALIGMLAERGHAVPDALLLDADQNLLVTSFVDGTDQVAEAQLDDALTQMVTFLVTLHGLATDALTDVPLALLENPVDALPRYLPESDAGARLGQMLDAQMLAYSAAKPSLIHGDYWPGNVLWSQGQLAAVIDWEDAALGDPLADLATARCELLCQYGQHACDSFTEQYLAATDADTTQLSIWDAYVSATALSSMHLWGLDADEEARRRALTHRFFSNAVAALDG